VWSSAAGFRTVASHMARLAYCGALGGASVNHDAANPTEPNIMSAAIIETATRSKHPVSTRRASGEEAKASQKPRSAPAVKLPMPAEAQREERLTKQERLLTLLSQPEGASIEEMMRATKWQQHSVRGFLAGTVKKKLGFSLTSSKLSGDVRRYRIETRRGR
jgi:uncharacterized protein DUF3489